MIARHGPSYHDNGGCDAYGYYGMTAVDGNVFFKKSSTILTEDILRDLHKSKPWTVSLISG